MTDAAYAITMLLQEKDTIRLRREAKVKGGFYVEPEAKLAFVVRIRGLNKIHPKVSSSSSSNHESQDFSWQHHVCDSGTHVASMHGCCLHGKQRFISSKAHTCVYRCTCQYWLHPCIFKSTCSQLGVSVACLQTKKILQLLRLRQINNGVFVRVSSSSNCGNGSSSSSQCGRVQHYGSSDGGG